MDPDTAFKVIFRLMLFCILIHVTVYLWAMSMNDLSWCSRRITKTDLANLTPPFKRDLWNYTWTSKEQLWCGFYN